MATMPDIREHRCYPGLISCFHRAQDWFITNDPEQDAQFNCSLTGHFAVCDDTFSLVCCLVLFVVSPAYVVRGFSGIKFGQHVLAGRGLVRLIWSQMFAVNTLRALTTVSEIASKSRLSSRPSYTVSQLISSRVPRIDISISNFYCAV